MNKTITALLTTVILICLSSCSSEKQISKEAISCMKRCCTEITETAKKTEKIAESGVDPAFKVAMESYEAFFDEYVEFMESYMNSDDLSPMMASYSDYMTEYIETMEKLETIDEDELTTEEALLYVEVTSRISQKLINVVE